MANNQVTFANICLGKLPSTQNITLGSTLTKYIHSSDLYLDLDSIKQPLCIDIKGTRISLIPISGSVLQNEQKITNALSKIKNSANNSDIAICIIDWEMMLFSKTKEQIITDIANADANVIIGYNSPSLLPYSKIRNTNDLVIHYLPSIGHFSYFEDTLHYFANLRLCSLDNSIYTQLSLIPIVSEVKGNIFSIDALAAKPADKREALLAKINELYPDNVLAMSATKKMFLHGSRLLSEIAKKTGIQYTTLGVGKAPLDLPISSDSSYEKAINSNEYDYYFFDLSKLTIDENWPETLEAYVTSLKRSFSPDQLILLKIKLPTLAVKRDQLRFHGDSPNTNALLEQMEDYVIRNLSPIVINVSELYFRDQLGGFTMAFESFFYDHCANIINNIVTGISSQAIYSDEDYDIFYDRVAMYYENMLARSYQRYFFKTDLAADLLARYTSADFIRKFKPHLVYLRSINASLDSVPCLISNTSSNKDLIRAVQAIDLVLKGNISEHVDSYSIIFEYGFSIIKSLATLLSAKTGYQVSYKNAHIILSIKDDPIALNEYFIKNPVTEIDVWGSCISRTVVDKAPDVLHVNNYVFKQAHPLFDRPPISTISLPPSLSAYMNNSWRQRTIRSSVLRDGCAIIGSSTSPWIIIDFFDLVCRACLIDGEILEVDDFIKKTDFYKAFAKRSKPTYLFRELSSEEILDGISKFARFISNKYKQNIILVCADIKANYIDLDGSTKAFDDKDNSYTEKVNCISLAEDLFIKLTGCHVINTSKKYQASDKFPLGGALQVHYEEGFYQEACAEIVSIIQKHTQRV